MEEATELEYLKWFRCNADFGPGHGDATAGLDRQFERETGKKVPFNWRGED